MSQVNDRTREQLLGYLLGALEDGEREELEQQLETHPEWHEELEALAAGLEPLAETYSECQPPAGLAARTYTAIFQHCPTVRLAFPGASRREVGRRRVWTIADAVVMAGISLAAAFLFFPAISQSRFEARLLACQNNLREIGARLVDYSTKAGRGCFPEVPTEGNCAVAGIYGPKLADAGYLMQPFMICPNSALAGETLPVSLPPSERELEQAAGAGLVVLQSLAGGSYGYTLGYVVDGAYRAPRNLGRSFFVLMADAPSLWLAGHTSSNHDGRGQNLLYEDGSVRFVSKLQADGQLDHPFQNRLGLMEAGIDANDSVVAPSATPPFERRSIVYLNR